MSYDVYVEDPERPESAVEIQGKNYFRGGTYEVGGTPLAHLNITYNYRDSFVKVFGEQGIRSLYGRTVGEVLPMLVDAIAVLGTDRDEDYWKATDGNAGAALSDLMNICLMCPVEGILRGD